MTALEELRAGEPAESFVLLLERTVRAVAIGRNFPAPEGHNHWDADAVAAVVAAFFASTQTPRRLTDLQTHCSSEEALKHRLQTSVRNFLADIGRQTEVGRLVLRINEVLSTEQTFERQGDRWAFTGSTGEPATEDVDDLVAAAATVPVIVPTAWSKSSSRKSPEIARSSVVRIASAILERAGGSVRPSVIAQVTAKRLGLSQTPLSIDATAFDPPQGGDILPDGTADEVVFEMRATEVFGLLNDAERAAIGLLNLSTGALGRLLGVSKATAHNIRTRARTILADELSDEENGQEVAEVVLDLARNWTSRWTIGLDAT